MKIITPAVWINRIVPLGLGLLIWAFFALFYRHHLHYQEQLQLFLTTSDYLCTHLAQPGGLAIYLGGFVTQFFVDSIWGGFLIALLLVAVQQLVALLIRRVSNKPAYLVLSCLPSVLYLLFLCDESVMISGVIALLLSLLAVWGYTRIPMYGVRVSFFLLMIPALYWLIGLGCVVFLCSCLFIEWTAEGSQRYRVHNAGMVLFGLLFFVLLPLTVKGVLGNMPLARFWFAGDYYRFVVYYQMGVVLVQLSTVGVLCLVRWLPAISIKKMVWVQLVQCCLLGMLVGWGINRWADWKKEEVMGYDYYARTQKWESIVGMADRQSPSGPLTAMTLNLALGRLGYLPDHMFTYFQNGPEGLLPSFTKDYISLVMTGEVYYYLGLVNMAQQFSFEAMEAIPDYQKSVRCIKRLAETNLINGRYTVAAKYLTMLQHTLFYRAWATDALTYLHDEARIDAHPEWGTLRRFSPKEDFLFSEEEKDQMLGILFQQNPDNRLAYEYLMAYTLLAKDMQHFPTYFMMGEQRLMFPSVPKSYQEALAYLWSLQPEMEPPLQVSKSVIQRMNNYRQVYTSLEHPEPVLRKDYSDTFWYYMQFRRN